MAPDREHDPVGGPVNSPSHVSLFEPPAEQEQQTLRNVWQRGILTVGRGELLIHQANELWKQIDLSG